MSTMATRYTQPSAWANILRRWLPQTAPLPHSTEGGQAQQFQQTFHCAYRRFTQHYPQWVSRGFDDEFLRRSLAPAFARGGRTATSALEAVSGYQLAWRWDQQFGPLWPEVVRTRQVIELIEVANHFLHLLRLEDGK